MAAELGAEPWIQGSPLGGGTAVCGTPGFLSSHTHTHRQCLCTHVRAEGFFFERINMTNSLQSTEVLDREQLLAVG